MLDYYGSIVKQREEIYNEIVSYFAKEEESVIRGFMDDLYESSTIPKEVSVSGWYVFIKKKIVDSINESLKGKKEVSSLPIIKDKPDKLMDDNKEAWGVFKSSGEKE